MPKDRPVVLIVDDQPLNLQHLAEVLDPDYRVKVTPSGREALALARRAPYPELILLDVMMPEMDGYAVCAALKQDPLTAAIPIIFITARTDTASETAALEAGAVDFIHKPINPEVVRARVRLQHELAQHRGHLEELVHARTRELAEARDAAEGANRAKTAFLRSASHEMRTPLNHITGMAYLLRKVLPDGQGRERLATIDRAAQDLIGLVTDLLDFTRIEAGEVVLESRPFDPRVLLSQVVKEKESAAVAKGLRLLTSVDPETPKGLIGDPDRLRQVLAQLVDNALKFSDQGTIQIQVRAGERRGPRLRLHFEVVDQGQGMDEERAARLFEPFGSGDHSYRRDHSGLGLGLALCQRLVRLMLGEIHLASAPGQGTRASFWAPLEIAAPPSDQARSPRP